MTTPDVPHRMELVYEVPGTPEQVWQALATANGITAWFIPTDMEERDGGAVTFHMGETSATGSITGWEPSSRLVYSEPDWAALAGHEGEAVSPLATEFLIEAQSGGTCVVRVVSSAFGTGADWEQEFFDEMEKGWIPFFDHLRLYLTHFPGQTVTPLALEARVPGTAAAVQVAMRQSLGIEPGKPFAVRSLSGHVLHGTDERMLVQLDDPLPGYIAFRSYDVGDDVALAQISGYLFSPDAAAYVERESAGWREWLQSLAVPAT
jgi:uncharacterized protein YndB with AHSA1/START domain